MKRSGIIGLIYTCAFTMVLISLFFCPAYGAEDEDNVYIIPVKGEITPAMAVFFKEKISEANNRNAKGIIVELTTLGGRVDSAIEMKEAILKSRVPIVVYVEGRAISAGALITIAAPKIIMEPGSHIGSAEPIPYSEKNVAFLRGEFQAAAKRWGRDEKIAQAMVDKNIEVTGLSPKGSLLDIDAETAYQYGYADAVLQDREEVLDYLGFKEMHIIEIVPGPTVRIAQFLTRSDVASFLLAVAFIALLAEFFIQGFGISGIIGIVSLILYFGGGYLAGYTEWWAIVLFIIGCILLIAELYVPGGIAGLSGFVCIVISLILAAPNFIQGFKYVGIALIAAVAAIPVLFYIFGKVKVFDRFILSDTVVSSGTASGRGEIDINTEGDAGDSHKWLGKTGVALSTLRPSGTAQIDGERIDVVSDGEFILPGTKVKVIKVDGLSIIVRREE